MSKKNPRRARQATPANPVTIPPQLAGLLALVVEQADADHADELGRALLVARATFRDARRADPPVFDRIAHHIGEEAARGPWNGLHRQLAVIERPEGDDQATAGDYQNVYGSPALLIGVALAYVYLTEGGAR